MCCGDQREVNISCPLDCEYLQEAHLHERPALVERGSFPNKDIRLSEEFVRVHDELILFSMFTLVDGALRTPGAVDGDVLKALEALIRTYRTRESGLVYETKAEDRVAAAVQDHFERSLSDLEKQRTSEVGVSAYRTAEILGSLVFVERSAMTHVNGRPRGRAFIDYTRKQLNIPVPGVSSGRMVS